MMKTTYLLMAAATLLVSNLYADEKPAAPAPANVTIGPLAKKGKGKAITIVKVNGKVVSKIEGAILISTSPDGRFALLAEAAKGDDSRHFLLNLGKGEYSKAGKNRLEYVIGGRYVEKAVWSEDSKFLTLYSDENLANKAEEVIDLSKH